jgi:glycine amidinotransferase
VHSYDTHGKYLHSYDEWSPLQEVIVGSPANYTAHDRDLSFDLFFADNLAYNGTPPRRSTRDRVPIKQRHLEELAEDVEGLAHTLESLSVTVRRPAPLARPAEIRTPAWSATVVPPLNVRDNALILGDEIIETPPLVRSRYFENQFLTSIFAGYFRAGARWTVMPRPLMTDASFGDSPHAEMMFDGAQCLRLGRDVIANVSTANHTLACDWLERHLAGRFRVHRCRLTGNHLDTTVLALRPGRLLVRSPAITDALPEPLRKWDHIIAPPPDAASPYEEDDLVLASPYIDLNVLSAGPDTVLVNAANTELIRTLERHRFTVVPVRHRHGRLFGGGLHCFTLDTIRAGAPEDYLD